MVCFVSNRGWQPSSSATEVVGISSLVPLAPFCLHCRPGTFQTSCAFYVYDRLVPDIFGIGFGIRSFHGHVFSGGKGTRSKYFPKHHYFKQSWYSKAPEAGLRINPRIPCYTINNSKSMDFLLLAFRLLLRSTLLQPPEPPTGAAAVVATLTSSALPPLVSSALCSPPPSPQTLPTCITPAATTFFFPSFGPYELRFLSGSQPSESGVWWYQISESSSYCFFFRGLVEGWRGVWRRW